MDMTTSSEQQTRTQSVVARLAAHFGWRVAPDFAVRVATRLGAAGDEKTIERTICACYYEDMYHVIRQGGSPAQAALDELFRVSPGLGATDTQGEYSGYLYRAARATLNQRIAAQQLDISSDDIEEIAYVAASATRIKIEKHIETVKEPGRFWGWFVRILSNEVVNELRRIPPSEPELKDEDSVDEDSQTRLDHAIPIVLTLRAELQRKAQTGELTTVEVRVLRLAFWDGLTNQEIAAISQTETGAVVKANTVAQIKRRSLVKLYNNLRHTDVAYLLS